MEAAPATFALYKHTHGADRSLRRLRAMNIDLGEITRMPAKKAQATSWLTGTALALLAPALAFAADTPPVPSKGDTAWMLTSTAFVLLMSVPALGLFYGGP